MSASDVSHTPATRRTPLPPSTPLTPASPTTERRINAQEDPKCIVVGEEMFYAVLHNLIHMASMMRSVEALTYDIVAHVLQAFCNALLAGFSHSPQPRIFNDREWRSPDFGVLRHLVGDVALAFAWEAKPLDVEGDWLGDGARLAADADFKEYAPQLFQQALFFFRSHPDKDVFYLICSIGLFGTSLLFRRPKLGDDEPDTPEPPVPRATKKQKKEYGALIEKLKDELAAAVEEHLRPEVMCFNEPLVDSDWHISPIWTHTLYTAASASYGGGLEIQKSWMKPPQDEASVRPTEGSLDIGAQLLKESRKYTLTKIREPLYELLDQNTWEKSGEAVHKSPSPYIQRKVVTGLVRRVMPDRGAKPPVDFNPPSDEYSSSPEPLPAILPQSPNAQPTVGQQLHAPFSPPEPRSSPIVDRQNRSRMQSNVPVAGPSNLGKRIRHDR